MPVTTGVPDAGHQLRIVPAPARRLVGVRVGVDDPDDLAPGAACLERLGVPARMTGAHPPR